MFLLKRGRVYFGGNGEHALFLFTGLIGSSLQHFLMRFAYSSSHSSRPRQVNMSAPQARVEPACEHWHVCKHTQTNIHAWKQPPFSCVFIVC